MEEDLNILKSKLLEVSSMLNKVLKSSGRQMSLDVKEYLDKLTREVNKTLDKLNNI